MLPACLFRAGKAFCRPWPRGESAVHPAALLPRTAGQPQGEPLRVRAPHRGALAGFPWGLAFFSQPRRFAWGSFAVVWCIPTPHPLIDGPHNGLTARLNGDVLHRHFLLAPAAICSQALRHYGEGPKRLRYAVHVAIHPLRCLIGEYRTTHKIHTLAMQSDQLRAQHHFHPIARRKGCNTIERNIQQRGLIALAMDCGIAQATWVQR